MLQPLSVCSCDLTHSPPTFYPLSFLLLASYCRHPTLLAFLHHVHSSLVSRCTYNFLLNMGFGTIILVGFITAGFAATGYMLSPKGPNQILYRTMVLMTLVCMYLMWAITYLAQLHPLIVPRRSDLKPEHFNHHTPDL
ncbi:ATP synthase subunit H-domain-containing protein [Syncephalis plumigaleata]|nr:ATP synthase subunit H-domain-containing protein [Syncephalis plumigaleata]